MLRDLKNKGRVLAIDYGTKRVGIAISDELGMLAFSRGTIDNRADLADQILSFLKREHITTVVLGVPTTLSGNTSEMTKEVLKFRDKLQDVLPENVSLETRDERLTSLIAETNIRARELPKKKRENKSLRDEEAARILLQEYLDTLN